MIKAVVENRNLESALIQFALEELKSLFFTGKLLKA